jgi:CRP/FNR family cyclic AMP-dependent transcriptional regulator
MFDRFTHHDHSDHPLANVTLFRACTPAELDTIVSVTTMIDVPAGRVLCVQGEGGDEFFVIIEGALAVSIDHEQVATLGPGEFFGEMALLDGGPRIATVTTTTPGRLLVLTRPEFHALLERAPTVCHRILVGIGHRLRQTTTQASTPPVGT